jgi:hypothetical protein
MKDEFREERGTAIDRHSDEAKELVKLILNNNKRADIEISMAAIVLAQSLDAEWEAGFKTALPLVGVRGEREDVARAKQTAEAWGNARAELAITKSPTGIGQVWKATGHWPIIYPDEDTKLFEGDYAAVDEFVELHCANAVLALLPKHTEPRADVEAVADAIDAARYQHPTEPRERPRPFREADSHDREYALRLARSAIAARPKHTGQPQEGDGEPWEYWRARAIAAEITLRVLSAAPAASHIESEPHELKSSGDGMALGAVDRPVPQAGCAKAREVEQWRRAIDSAASQFESYVRQDELKTAEQRRAALDDAFQHAYGLLALSTSPPLPVAEREWQDKLPENILARLDLLEAALREQRWIDVSGHAATLCNQLRAIPAPPLLAEQGEKS